MARRSSPEVNAGSMADIAFLLLIFFLVTTTIETDSGISRKLPPMEESEEDVVIKQKNIFTVLLNGKDLLLEKLIAKSKITNDILIFFIINILYFLFLMKVKVLIFYFSFITIFLFSLFK